MTSIGSDVTSRGLDEERLERAIVQLELASEDARWVRSQLQEMSPDHGLRAAFFIGNSDRMRRHLGADVARDYDEVVSTLGGMPSPFSFLPVAHVLLMNVAQAKVYAPGREIQEGIEASNVVWASELKSQPMFGVFQRILNDLRDTRDVMNVLRAFISGQNVWCNFGVFEVVQVNSAHARVQLHDFYPGLFRHVVTPMARVLLEQVVAQQKAYSVSCDVKDGVLCIDFVWS
jgi:hypothetical protein